MILWEHHCMLEWAAVLLHAFPETPGKAHFHQRWGFARRWVRRALLNHTAWLVSPSPLRPPTTTSPIKVPGGTAWSVWTYWLHFPEGWGALQGFAQEACAFIKLRNVCFWIQWTARNFSDLSGVSGRAWGAAQNTVAARSLLCSYQIVPTLCDALKNTFHTQMDYYWNLIDKAAHLLSPLGVWVVNTYHSRKI